MSKVFSDTNSEELIKLIRSGGVGILRTDTLYGIVARADNEQAVERVFKLKQRTPTKPPIVLIGDITQLYDPVPENLEQAIAELWPGANSIVLPSSKAPDWLIRGSQGVAYRLPDNLELRQFLQKTEPIIAPSANPEAQPPAQSINEAQNYFGDLVDFYVEGGIVTSTTPSRLFATNEKGRVERLR